MIRPAIGGLALILAAAGTTGAQETATTSGVAAVLACRTVRPDKAQLACFRRAADALASEPAPAPGPPDVQSQTQAQTRVQATPPRPPPFGLHAPRPKPVQTAQSRVTLKLVSVSDRGDGRAVMTFDDGSTWIEIDADPIVRALRPGESLTIQKGALGSYLLDLPHRSAVHVRRAKGS
jgi:hypothetical protein